MTDLEKIIKKQFYFDEDGFLNGNYFYQFIRDNPFISSYSYLNGQKYFFFAVSGRIFYVSEFWLSFLIFTGSYFGVIGLRKLFKKYRISKKLRKKFEKILKKIKTSKKVQNPKVLELRGGQNFEKDILHYEIDPIDSSYGSNYVPIPDIFSQLSFNELFTKALIQKCLQPGRFYKIKNRGLLEIVEQMVGFSKKENTRIISYDILILALVKYAQPSSHIVYEGTMKIAQKLGFSAAIRYAPLIFSILIGVGGGFSFNLATGNIFIGFFSTIPTWFSSYRAAEYVRDAVGIDCNDYWEELPFEEKNLLSEGPSNLESQTNQNSKVSVALSKPDRHDTFVSTAPDQQLHYEKKVKIDSLDGFYKEEIKVSGERIFTWKPNSNNNQISESHYVKLEDRTKTMRDLRDLDSTSNRQAAERIRYQIEREQIAMKILNELGFME